MAIKTYKPTTPSRRNMTVTDYSGLSKVKPAKTRCTTRSLTFWNASTPFITFTTKTERSGG